jgi:CubicO group peptidase (beta-lactamase class C family)
MTDETRAIQDVLAYVPGYFAFQQSYVPFVGAQIAVRKDGELLHSSAVGYADLANKTPLTTSHLFRIASHSKTFTGVAIMQLAEQGKLRLDDSAGQHVPELAGSNMACVTIRELLGHSSGMTRDGDDCSFWALDRAFPDRTELVTTIRQFGKVLEPNEHFKYSNIGFSLLGLIIEGASGKPYREYVTENIVDRLELHNTGPDLNFDRLDDYAKGYSSRVHGPDRVEIEHIDTYAESSATGFYSTAEELTAYFQAHLDGDERLISDASKRRMRQVQWSLTDESKYGLGLGVSVVNGRTYYGHGGGYPGHITRSRLDLERNLSISVLTNANDGPAALLCDAVLKLIDVALGKDVKSKPGDPEALKKFVGRFATLWGITDVVNLGNRLFALSPAASDPTAMINELEMVSETELKVIGDDGYGGYGERMRYTFNEDGSVAVIRGATGMKLVPIEEFKLPGKLVRPTRQA